MLKGRGCDHAVQGRARPEEILYFRQGQLGVGDQELPEALRDHVARRLLSGAGLPDQPLQDGAHVPLG